MLVFRPGTNAVEAGIIVRVKLARSSAIVLVLALAAVLNSGWVWSGAAMQLGRYGLWACLTVFLSA
ncbi:MAG: hypothetical protein ACI9HK_005638, partial [Pirellulaceae bacterium]